jgi:hypothetical protein
VPNAHLCALGYVFQAVKLQYHREADLAAAWANGEIGKAEYARRLDDNTLTRAMFNPGEVWLTD